MMIILTMRYITVGVELPIFSPSQTALYDKCPTQWYLEHELQLVPRIATPKLLGGMFGSSAAKALAIYHKYRKVLSQSQLRPKDIDSYVGIGFNEWKLDYEHYLKYGVVFPDLKKDEHLSNLENLISKYCVSMAIPETTEIVSVEEASPEFGNSRSDLIIKDNFGTFSVVDVKCKQKLEAKYYDKTVMDYDKDWAQLHYLWSHSQKLGKALRRYYILLIVATPTFSARLHPFTVSDYTLKMYETSARNLWGRVAYDKGRIAEFGNPVMQIATIHKDQFGVCPMYDACFTYNGDMELIKSSYVQVPRRN